MVEKSLRLTKIRSLAWPVMQHCWWVSSVWSVIRQREWNGRSAKLCGRSVVA